MRFRLLTYNIHKGIGGFDRRYRPERITETIAHYEPDIVFLQEVDDGVPRSRGHRQVDTLGEALSFPYRAYQKNVALRQGHYGNAILSRYPLAQVQDLDLTVRFKKRRQGLTARCRVEVNGHRRSLLLMNLHLGLAGYERVTQLNRVMASHVCRFHWRRTPMIIGGDLNDVWGNLGPRVIEPHGLKPTGPPLNTFPAIRPLRPLDRIFYRGPLECTHCYRSHTQLSRFASDHLPLIADFEWH